MLSQEKEREKGVRKAEGAIVEVDLKENLAKEEVKTERGGKFGICLVEESGSQKREEQEVSVWEEGVSNQA